MSAVPIPDSSDSEKNKNLQLPGKGEGRRQYAPSVVLFAAGRSPLDTAGARQTRSHRRRCSPEAHPRQIHSHKRQPSPFSRTKATAYFPRQSGTKLAEPRQKGRIVVGVVLKDFTGRHQAVRHHFGKSSVPNQPNIPPVFCRDRQPCRRAPTED